MKTIEQRLKDLERLMQKAMATVSALQGFPGDATLSIPHNDSWVYADNDDGTHAANLYYVIPSNVSRVVTAKLSMKMLPYRTYNSLTFSNTGIESGNHTHGSATHHHEMWTVLGGSPGSTANTFTPASGVSYGFTSDATHALLENTFDTTPGSTGGQSADHTHPISGTSVLGITEGATATGVTISFDGVDHTADLKPAGPYNADIVELDVRRFLVVTTGVWHVIAMQPSGLGRINAHLRLGYYASAGSSV